MEARCLLEAVCLASIILFCSVLAGQSCGGDVFGFDHSFLLLQVGRVEAMCLDSMARAQRLL